MNNEEFKINLRVNNKLYPITLKNRDDEEVYRRAASQIDFKLAQYKSANYKVDDPEFFMGMTAIQALKEKNSACMHTEKVDEDLRKLINEIDDFIKTKIR